MGLEQSRSAAGDDEFQRYGAPIKPLLSPTATERATTEGSCASSDSPRPMHQSTNKPPDLSRFETAPITPNVTPPSSYDEPSPAGVSSDRSLEAEDISFHHQLASLDLDEDDTRASDYSILSSAIIVSMAEMGDYRKVRLLVEADEDVNATDKDGNTCLHVAAVNGHEDIVWYMLQNSADTARRNILDDTPLHDAARCGHLKIVRMLLDAGACAGAVNDDGDTPLHGAVKAGYAEVANELLNAGAPAGAANKWGLGPLHVAALKGNLPLMEVIVSKGASVSAAAEGAPSPLHSACEGGQLAAAEWLLSRGAKCQETDSQGRLAASCIGASVDPAVAQRLQEVLAQ